LTVASPSRRTTNRPWKGRGYVTWHVLNFGCPIRISGMAEATALKFCTKEDYIKSGQRDDKSPLKGPWFCSRDPFFVCTAVKLETYSPRHSASCYKQCRARRTAVYRSTCAWGHAHRTLRLRPKLHRFDLSLCLLQTWLYNIQTTNRLSGVWALSFKYFLLCLKICCQPTHVACIVIILRGTRAIWSIFTAWRYAKRSTCRHRVSVRPSVCVCVCHTLVLCKNG